MTGIDAECGFVEIIGHFFSSNMRQIKQHDAMAPPRHATSNSLPSYYFFGIIIAMHATLPTVLNRPRSAAPGSRALAFAGRGQPRVACPAFIASVSSIIRIIQGR